MKSLLIMLPLLPISGCASITELNLQSLSKEMRPDDTQNPTQIDEPKVSEKDYTTTEDVFFLDKY